MWVLAAAAAGAAARLEHTAEERQTVAEEEGCGQKFGRRWNRSSCAKGGRLEHVAAGLGEPRIEAAVAALAAGLAVAHIAAVVESVVGRIVGPAVGRIAVVVVVDTAAAVAAAAEEERGTREWMTWAAAWQTSRRTEEEEDNAFLAAGWSEEMGKRTLSGLEEQTWEEVGSCVEQGLLSSSVSTVPSAFQYGNIPPVPDAPGGADILVSFMISQ